VEKKLNRRKVYTGRIIKLFVDEVSVKNRKTSREIITHPGSSVILPVINEKRGEILIIRQYRYAAGAFLYELPAGTKNKKETSLQCAKRELAEETGYKAGHIKKLISFYPSPGISDEFMAGYCAYGLKPVNAKKDFDENITVEKITLKKAFSMIEKGLIKDAKTTAALLYFMVVHKKN